MWNFIFQYRNLAISNLLHRTFDQSAEYRYVICNDLVTQHMKELMFSFLPEENGHNACNTSTYDQVNPRRTICTFCLAEIKKKPTYHNTSSQWNTYNTENTYYNFYSPSPPPTTASKYWFCLVLIIKIMLLYWKLICLLSYFE